MKPQEVKAEFIRLRAEGHSYSAICEQLHIAKTTCIQWEKDLAENISDLKRAALVELCEAYGMAKEARIDRLGRTLNRINDALAAADLSQIPPEKLLDYQLKYMDALKNEYTRLGPAFPTVEAVTSQNVTIALGDLLNRVRAGDIPLEQVDKENRVLTSLASAVERREIGERLEKMEAIMERANG